MSAADHLPPLQLKKNEDRRIRAGHLWIYSNEVDTARTPLKGRESGGLANITDHRGKPLGTAYVNPHSLISARLISRRADTRPDRDWFARRITRALVLRQRLYDAPYYRLIYGESDGLPGVVVDRFGDVLAVQITTLGMEMMGELFLDALDAVLEPAVIILRNDSAARELEGLETYVDCVKGELPEQVLVRENDTEFAFAAAGGQKTGWFFDHRDNRRQLQTLVRDRRVLDVFSYVGAWGIEALSAGASEVVFVDSSATALAQLEANLQRNGLAAQATHKGDAFAVLKGLINDGERFDVVVVDPPAFIKRRKDMKAGQEAYQRINRLALRLLGEDGILVSASCSWHLSREQLINVVRHAGQQAGRLVQIIHQGHQGGDHPVLPAMSETDYLKACFCRVI
ncbi:MAG TPA: class I SAM-dependent rRNA methyltransferase [Gammaproteobacteria bacterium]|nr:class I SAM-dependent rRNA methyltransferase [Gammaproteobacteria bacterium]